MGDSTVKVFDPDGDVRLLIYDSVEHDTVRKDFLVNSRALSLASDVWKAMFSGRFRESSRSRDEGIEFQDDNPEALATLLSIAHLRFHEVPQESEMKFHQLVGITVLTDKYGATHLLRPWFKSWLESARQYLHKTGYEEWLWIAWELGLVQTFENLSRHLVKSTRLDFDYRLMNKEGDVLHPNLKDLYLPPEIMQSIIEVRQTVLLSICSIYHQKLEEFVAAGRSGKTRCRVTGDNRTSMCDSMAYDSLTLALKNAGLPTEEGIPEEVCVNEVAAKLRDIEVQTWTHTSRFDKDACRNADIMARIDQELDEVLSDIPSAVTDMHRCHLQRQAEKLGL
ncbi:hypothetical protein IWZ01DRAFT_575819 [Phyllosticta capitalensis]